MGGKPKGVCSEWRNRGLGGEMGAANGGYLTRIFYPINEFSKIVGPVDCDTPFLGIFNIMELKDTAQNGHGNYVSGSEFLNPVLGFSSRFSVEPLNRICG